MHEPAFITLLQGAYTRSDLAYKISLLRELLEFLFFTEHKEVVDKDGISLFGERVQSKKEDIDFLNTLPVSFLGEWKKASFYDMINRYADEVEKLPILALVVPVEFSQEGGEIAKLGQWARKEVDPTILLKVRVEPSLSVGCRFVWNDKLYDFSLEHYFHQHKKTLHTRLSSLALGGVVTGK